jgi:hypothetical protein
MAQTKDLFGAVDTYMSHQHDIEAILGGGKVPSSPTTARHIAELEAHAPTTALAGRLAGCVCSLFRLQLAQLVLRVEALVVAKSDDETAVRELLMTSDDL